MLAYQRVDCFFWYDLYELMVVTSVVPLTHQVPNMMSVSPTMHNQEYSHKFQKNIAGFKKLWLRLHWLIIAGHLSVVSCLEVRFWRCWSDFLGISPSHCQKRRQGNLGCAYQAKNDASGQHGHVMGGIPAVVLRTCCTVLYPNILYPPVNEHGYLPSDYLT